MADRTFKANDTWPPLAAVLSDANGPIDLTNATQVKLLMRTGSTLVSGLCQLDTNPITGARLDRTLGQVFYVWVRGDTAIVGDYQVEFEITWAGTTPTTETVPNDSYDSISIIADLG